MRVHYIQPDGFKQVRAVPETVTDPKEYSRGILIGPPDLSSLGLSPEKTKMLNNWLVDQGLETEVELNKPGGRDKLLTGINNVIGSKDKQFMIRVLIIYQDYFNGG